MQSENGHQQSVLRQMLAEKSEAAILGLLSPSVVTAPITCFNNNEINSGTSTRSVSPVDR